MANHCQCISIRIILSVAFHYFTARPIRGGAGMHCIHALGLPVACTVCFTPFIHFVVEGYPCSGGPLLFSPHAVLQVPFLFPFCRSYMYTRPYILSYLVNCYVFLITIISLSEVGVLGNSLLHSNLCCFHGAVVQCGRLPPQAVANGCGFKPHPWSLARRAGALDQPQAIS